MIFCACVCVLPLSWSRDVFVLHFLLSQQWWLMSDMINGLFCTWSAYFAIFVIFMDWYYKGKIIDGSSHPIETIDPHLNSKKIHVYINPANLPTDLRHKPPLMREINIESHTYKKIINSILIVQWSSSLVRV